MRHTIFTLIIFAALAMTGCTPATRYVPFETVRTEYLQGDTARLISLIRTLREEITQKQSRIESLIHKEQDKETVRVNENGDTISRVRIHNEYIHLEAKERSEYEHVINSQRDSIEMLKERLASVKTDSIAVPYPVERKLTKWEQTKMDLGGMAIGGTTVLAVVVAGMAVWLIKIKRRR